ncbi:ComEA family DNA-binding protein [Flavobacterium luminosum]|uniref:Helix-hairpin-helix domain-containing protein n=1 Tax=Flavobacterium luminosum TaxID=2949086 RepID=A0ABT0TKA4_9FLAO|nr:helix-hairpin-helix domain-containing protein [Flavobacterium sp. HXWNR70]MCL9807896.1 helix-hairpin-helix domain-containing protein [Flavobacterium sp. HXWNR70]
MNFKDLLNFNREQRIGLVILVAIIISLQLSYYLIDFSSTKKMTPEEEKWLSMQTAIDSLKNNSEENSYKMYPFNPNFITDFKGYKLGMNVEEIDRLLAFRKTGKFVNSAEEFQKVTKVSDSLLAAISPYFKFPDWVKNKQLYAKQYPKYEAQSFYKKEKKIVILDINQASKEDLMKIYGIGDAISDRILKQKEQLGGFVSMAQMEDVWGLSPEVIAELNKYFRVTVIPEVRKIDINNESVKNLAKFPYFRYALAREIVTYRSMNNGIKSIEDLTKVQGFPVDKSKIIALYLDF